MSARVLHQQPSMSKYETGNLATGASFAASPAELRAKLEASRNVWQKKVDTDHQHQVRATELEISKRTSLLKERAKQRLMPSQKSLEAQARLQLSLADAGAAATAAYHGQATAARSFEDRVANAVGTSLGPTEHINFGNAVDPACLAAAECSGEVATPEQVGEMTGALVGFAEAERNVLIKASQAATEELRRVATQASDEVAFVVKNSTGAIDERLQASAGTAVSKMTETMVTMESKVEAMMGQTMQRLDAAQATMAEMTATMTQCANAACAATEAATTAAAQIGEAAREAAVATATAITTSAVKAASTANSPTGDHHPGHTSATHAATGDHNENHNVITFNEHATGDKGVVVFSDHADILDIKVNTPYNRETLAMAYTAAATRFAASLPVSYNAELIRAAHTGAIQAFQATMAQGATAENWEGAQEQAQMAQDDAMYQGASAATATPHGTGDAPGTGTPTHAPTSAPGTGNPTNATHAATHATHAPTGNPTSAPGTGNPTGSPTNATHAPTSAPSTGNPTHAATHAPTSAPGTGEPHPTGEEAACPGDKKEEEEEDKPKETAKTAAPAKTGFRAIFR